MYGTFSQHVHILLESLAGFCPNSLDLRFAIQQSKTGTRSVHSICSDIKSFLPPKSFLERGCPMKTSPPHSKLHYFCHYMHHHLRYSTNLIGFRKLGPPLVQGHTKSSIICNKACLSINHNSKRRIAVSHLPSTN